MNTKEGKACYEVVFMLTDAFKIFSCIWLNKRATTIVLNCFRYKWEIGYWAVVFVIFITMKSIVFCKSSTTMANLRTMEACHSKDKA